MFHHIFNLGTSLDGVQTCGDVLKLQIKVKIIILKKS